MLVDVNHIDDDHELTYSEIEEIDDFIDDEVFLDDEDEHSMKHKSVSFKILPQSPPVKLVKYSFYLLYINYMNI